LGGKTKEKKSNRPRSIASTERSKLGVSKKSVKGEELISELACRKDKRRTPKGILRGKTRFWGGR